VLKITTNFGDDVYFLHAFYLRFTILTLILYTFQLCQNSARPSHGVITTVSVLNNWFIATFTVSCLTWSQQFNRTHFR